MYTVWCNIRKVWWFSYNMYVLNYAYVMVYGSIFYIRLDRISTICFDFIKKERYPNSSIIGWYIVYDEVCYDYSQHF